MKTPHPPEPSEFTSAYCRIQALNMLEDLANTTPLDAATRLGKLTATESNDAAPSAENEPHAAGAAENDVKNNAATDGLAAAKLAAETKKAMATKAAWPAPIPLADALGPVPSTSGDWCDEKGVSPMTP